MLLAVFIGVNPTLLPPLFATSRPLALYTSEVCVGHEPGGQTLEKKNGFKGYSHPEQPARLRELQEAMRRKWKPEFGKLLQVKDGGDVTREQIRRVHSLAHISNLDQAFLRASFFKGKVKIDGADTIASPGTGAAARRAAGLVVSAVDDLCSAEALASKTAPRRAFVMARPPGHHAERDKAMGFCFLNNVLIGVAHAQRKHGVGRVAILDFDVHHGNGDEDIAENNKNRLYVSSHEVPNFPGTGSEQGRAGKFGNVVNVPLAAASGSREFRRAWSQQLLPAIREFKPDCIFVSAGFDAHVDDPLSSIRLRDDDYAWITGEVGKIAGEQIPIISVLEGGYNVDRLKTSVRTHIRSLIAA